MKSKIQKYLGVYTLFYEQDLTTGKPAKDKETGKYNIYIKGKYNTEAYRYNNNTIAIYFPSNQTLNKLNAQNIKYSILSQGDTESIILVKEKDIDKLHSILKFMIKGKNDQLKEAKRKAKEEKLKVKNKK